MKFLSGVAVASVPLIFAPNYGQVGSVAPKASSLSTPHRYHVPDEFLQASFVARDEAACLMNDLEEILAPLDSRQLAKCSDDIEQMAVQLADRFGQQRSGIELRQRAAAFFEDSARVND